MHVLSADMNAGKTTRIGKDWVQSAKAQGAYALVLCPLNSLGQQTAADWGLPQIHDYPKDERALWSAVKRQKGIVMCPDSLHRLPLWMLKEPLVLILDEANQVVDHTNEGDTLGHRWSAIQETLAEVAKQAIATGAIILSEAGLPDRAVDFIQAISGAETVRPFTHKKQGMPWDCRVFHGNQNGFRAALLTAIKQGKKILYVTSSQQEGRILAMALRESRLKVTRIDSETNQQGQFTRFFNSPDQWLAEEQPDVLILSPSAKSGVSIEGGVSVEQAHFSEVWGYFSALDTDTHLQLLGRYRPSVPRFMFCPDFVMTSGDEAIGSPHGIQRRLWLNAKSMAGAYGLSGLLEADEKRAAHLLQIETASQTYLAAARTVSGAQKSIARLALIRRLEQAGHSVTTEAREKHGDTKELWSALREEVWREDARSEADAVVTDRHTLEWAIETLGAFEATLEDRTVAHKVLHRSEFPGVTFDDEEECYWGITHRYGETRRGVLLQARAENLAASKEADREDTEGILTDKIRALHRLPKQHARAALIAETGVLSLLAGAYTNQDKRAIAVKAAALKYATEISYSLRLNIRESQTPVEVSNKLLKKLGLEGVEQERVGKRGQQIRVYEVQGHARPVRIKLLEAARRKLSESVATIRKGEADLPLRIVATPPEAPPDKGLRAISTVKTAGGLAMIRPIRPHEAFVSGVGWQPFEDLEVMAA